MEDHQFESAMQMIDGRDADIARLTRELTEARAEAKRLDACASSWERCADEARAEIERLQGIIENMREIRTTHDLEQEVRKP